MKSKIISFILCAAVIFATFWLIRNAPSELPTSVTEEENQSEETTPHTEPPKIESSRTTVIEAAHDAEDLMTRLAYGSDKSYKVALDALIVRLEDSATYLKEELEDYYGATYFTKIASVFRDVSANPFENSTSFGARVGKILTELENAYPADLAASANENDPVSPMYYPKFDTDPNGSFALAMLAVYRQQYQQTTGSVLLTFGGNLMMGDSLLGASEPNSFKNQQVQCKYSYPLYGVSSVLCTDSVSFGNLTSPFTDSIEISTVAGSIKGLPGYSALLKSGGVDVVALSDDRMLSYGPEGKSDTKTALNQAGVSFSDEGTVAYLETSLGKVAYLTYNIIEEITQNVNLLYQEAPKQDIAAAKAQGAKFVVVHFNWFTTEDNEWDPCGAQFNTARAAVDHGANLVIGTSPDAIASIERYNGVNIVYSPGSLYNRQGEESNSFLFQQAFSLDANGNAVLGEIQIIPISHADSNEVSSPILDAKGANEFREAILAASKPMRNGVGKTDKFPVEDLHIISIEK